MPKKILLFGGTFDPVHNGHLRTLSFAAERIGADRIILIPAARSPLKEDPPKAAASDRLRMLELAVKDCRNFSLSRYELDRPQPSYTIETVKYFRSQFEKDAQLYWLIGADAAESLSKWYRISELIELCNICIMYRGGCKKPEISPQEPFITAAQAEKLSQNIIETPLIDISSTKIREMIAKGQDISTMVPPAVEEYIRQKKLYR